MKKLLFTLLLLSGAVSAAPLKVDARYPSGLYLRPSGTADYQDTGQTTPVSVVVEPSTRYDLKVVGRVSFFRVAYGEMAGVIGGQTVDIPETEAWDWFRLVLALLPLPAAGAAWLVHRRPRRPKDDVVVPTVRRPESSTAWDTGGVTDRVGDYRLLRRLGRGGMAVVWEVLDDQENHFAMKMLLPTMEEDEELMQRFAREMEIGRRLQHRNIVRLHDYSLKSRHGPFMVMELVVGPSLAQLLVNGSLAPAHAVGVVRDVLLALQYAHTEGVIHRDVKPANILLPQSGGVKLSDYGIARHLDDATLTGLNREMGSKAYMAPEQICAHRVDHRADLYATGCVLFEALTGKAPFGTTDAKAIMTAKLNADPPLLSSVSNRLPKALDAILQRAMARNPDDRYPDADSFRRALEGVRF
ncbi:MAG TPA: serine/threonine-protein kinase [Candidatus Xenobia bacterium]|jgi:hypothetical protein